MVAAKIAAKAGTACLLCFVFALLLLIFVLIVGLRWLVHKLINAGEPLGSWDGGGGGERNKHYCCAGSVIVLPGVRIYKHYNIYFIIITICNASGMQ